jgi:hypothetical protein
MFKMFSTNKYDLLFLFVFSQSNSPQKTNNALETGFGGDGRLLELSG